MRFALVIYSSKQGKLRMRSPSANALLFMPASPLPANLLQKQNLCGSPVNACGKSARSFVGMWRIWRVFARGADTALTTPIPPLSKKSLPKQIFFGRGKGVGLPSSLTQAKGLPQKSRWRVLRDKKCRGLPFRQAPASIFYIRESIVIRLNTSRPCRRLRVRALREGWGYR